MNPGSAYGMEFWGSEKSTLLIMSCTFSLVMSKNNFRQGELLFKDSKLINKCVHKMKTCKLKKQRPHTLTFTILIFLMRENLEERKNGSEYAMKLI
jgi:hypothetical protein